jgi:hypothetical protein
VARSSRGKAAAKYQGFSFIVRVSPINRNGFWRDSTLFPLETKHPTGGLVCVKVAHGATVGQQLVGSGESFKRGLLEDLISASRPEIGSPASGRGPTACGTKKTAGLACARRVC